MSSRPRQRRGPVAGEFFPAEAGPAVPWLVTATDLGLLAALWLVPLCLGGRLAVGQGVLVAAAVWSAGCWGLYQVGAEEGRWIWTRSEWLWLAALALVGLQLVSLPPAWLHWLSPAHAEYLVEWQNPAGGLLGKHWSTLSLAPSETRSALATFVAYALLFLVAVQRCRTLRDVARWLQWIAAATVAIAVFSLVHYALSNGKFFGWLQHPFADPRRYNLGPFTNRNHLAQFLSLGLGPLLWWWLKSTSPPEWSSEAAWKPARSSPKEWVVSLLFLAAQAVVVLAVLLTQSRGGVLALGLAGLVALGGFQRARLVSPQFVLALFAGGVVTAGVAWVAGSQEVLRRFDETGRDGRWIIWRANLEVVRRFPWWGTGVGTHADAHHLFLDQPYNGYEYTHADNSYLQVASECGLAGLAIAGCMIWQVLGWPCGVLRRNQNPATAGMAAALLGSLTGHAAHAVFDFLWYVPGCMVVVLLLAAAACRLSQLDREAEGRRPPELPCPRWCWTAVCLGLVWLGPWLWAQKAGAIAAEPHRLRYLNLLFVPWQVFPLDDQPETQVALQRAKARAAVQAAKADRQNGQYQLVATLAYQQMFEQLQQQSDNPMSLAQLRDAAVASGFESTAALREWIVRATGKHARLLDEAWKSGVRCIELSPLDGQAYVYLAEMSFLHDLTGALQQRLLKQALAVRPYDPQVLYAVGREALLMGREDEALNHWKRAFRYGPLFQKRIVDVLAVEKSADFFLREFQPDWEAQGRICEAFRAHHRASELTTMLRSYAESATQFARRQVAEKDAAPAWLAARAAWKELQQTSALLSALREAVRQHPHSLELRRALGEELYQQREYAEAAEHLRWAAERLPDDADLHALAGQALRGQWQAQSSTSGRRDSLR
uniref:O-antigen ligase-related domain-containing protein n=1 Tax=Schlesneria paludicola TaxID=360056 RepID=A0A7C4QU34_9PLAN